MGLKVTDDEGGTATTTRTVTDHGSLPHAQLTAAPSPAASGATVTFDASGSSDADGPLTYEWDLDNNGTYETNTGSTPTATRSFAKAGEYTVGVKVTDTDTTTDTAKAAVVVQNQGPSASFTAPSSVTSGTQVSFDASGSADPDGSIAKYEWDLDGNGTYETSTGTTPTTSKTYATPGEITIGLQVTDDEGATATTTRALTIQNRAPAASFTASPNPVATGIQVTFNGAGSTDPDGTIAKYEWDLDGNGTYETDTGATATTTNTYATAANLTIGLRVTDNNGATATTTRALTVQNRAPTASFTASPNPVPTGTPVAFDASGSTDPDGTIAKYEWDLDGNGTYETNTGTTATTSKTYATAANLTIRLRVTDNEGATATTTRALTVQNRAPTASFTASPNPVISGSVVSFNGSGSTDPDGTIAKYEWDLDGNGTYETSTGTTPTVNKTYSASGEYTIGLRVTDNNGATATTTRALTIQNRAPAASFTASPNPVATGTQVTFNGAGSTDPDGTIAKYEWDLDGNGTYETVGTTATTTKAYAAPATLTIGLRVTDNGGATATTTRTLTVQNRAPTASFTLTPNPATAGTAVIFDATGSTDPDGTIAKYEWDLDGNGTYETSTGTTPTTTKTYATAATLNIGLRVTDNSGATATSTKALTVRSAYNAAVLGTSGLIDYWRLGETSGTSLADAIGGRTASTQGGVTLGGAGALASDPDKSASFNGTNGAATATVNFSSLSAITVEFWMNWSTFANDNDMALELTQNSTLLSGGFFIEPDSTNRAAASESASAGC